MIRALWFYVVLVISTVYHAAAATVAGLLGVRHRSGGVYDWAGTDWARQILRAAGTPVQAEGLELIPRDRPVLYASNHSSMFDIWALFATLPGSVRFVAKQELFRIPLLGGAMRAVGHVAIDRTHRKRAFEAYDDAARTIQRGVSAVVFPEGTRSRTGELLPFKKGAFILAIRAQAPLVPMAIVGARAAMKKGSFIIWPVTIRIRVGEPVPTAGIGLDGRDGLMQTLRERIQGLLRDLADH